MKFLKEFFSKINYLMATSLGMVTALAWNSAFQNFFNKYPKLKDYGPWVYAILITIIAIIIFFLLNFFFSNKKESKNNNFNSFLKYNNELNDELNNEEELFL